MAFSLGSIYVELVANTGKFLSGLDQASIASKRTGKDIRAGLGEVGTALSALGPTGERVGAILEGVGSKAGAAFDVAAKNGRGLGTLFAGSMLGGVTALAGGLLALAGQAASVGSKIYDASEKTGISAGQMSGLMALTKEVGGNFDGLTTSLARAGANLEKTAEGAGKTDKALFQMMGGAKGAAELGLKPMGDRIQAVLGNIFKLHDAGQRNLALNQLLGKGWQENITTLRILAEQGYGPAIAKAHEFGMFFDAEHAAQAKQYEVEMEQFKGQMVGLGLAIGQYVIPYVKNMMQWFSSLWANLRSGYYAANAVFQALHGNIFGAKKDWAEYEKASAQADQQQTDFLVHAQNLTEGMKYQDTALKGLTGTTKHHADGLAELIEREKDQLSELNIHGSKWREIQAEYDRTVREINKLVAAGGSVVESYHAQSLALDLYNKRLREYIENATKIPKLPTWGEAFAAAGGAPEPNLHERKLTTDQWSEALPAGIGQRGVGSLTLVLSQMAELRGSLDSTRGEERALKEETELSDAAFQKLAKTFPGLTEAEVAATAAGRKMIEQLTQMDKLGTAAEQFEEFKNRLILDGQDLAGHLIKTLGGALDQLEDQLARLVSTGKANFRQMAQGIEEQILKAGMQKGVGSVMAHFGVNVGGKKGDSRTNPLWVKAADGGTVGTASAGGAGTAGGGQPGAASGAGNGGAEGVASALTRSAGSFSSTLNSAGNLVLNTWKAFGPALTKLGSWVGSGFGGYLAAGGDVSPGNAYVVGERHPELFVPGVAGTVVPSLRAQELRPLHYSPTFHINTPNPDSFRRSQNQILTEGYRTMLVVHGRNS